MDKNYYTKYLAHWGIKGQKWGIRRYQNPDGSLTEAGKERYGKYVQKLEKKASKKSGQGAIARLMIGPDTGENYKKALRDFRSGFKTDKKYIELTKKAFDLEQKRLLEMTKYDLEEQLDWDWESMPKSFKELTEKSAKASEEVDKYKREKAKEYLSIIKDAKIKDLNITENKELAKTFLSDQWNDTVINYNLSYDPGAIGWTKGDEKEIMKRFKFDKDNIHV